MTQKYNVIPDYYNTIPTKLTWRLIIFVLFNLLANVDISELICTKNIRIQTMVFLLQPVISNVSKVLVCIFTHTQIIFRDGVA